MGDRAKRIIAGILRYYVVIFLLNPKGFLIFICSLSFPEKDLSPTIHDYQPIAANTGYCSDSPVKNDITGRSEYLSLWLNL